MKIKLSVLHVLEIHELLKRGVGQQAIADSFGVSQSLISRISSGQRKKYLGVTLKSKCHKV